MRKAIAIIAALCGIGVATAGPVGPERAAAVARSFWSTTLHGKADAVLVDRTAEWAYDGIYLFQCTDGGFVMVSADDATRPILGYSADGTIEPDGMPVQLAEWLGMYQQQIDWVRQHDGQPYAADREAWQLLIDGQPLKGTKSQAVEPLLTTKWDQTWPYNILCPGNTVTGCAATAQAQMMKYWNHPTVGYGSHHYTHATYGQQSADFGHTIYQWGSMPNQPSIYSTGFERLAVATLMYHCGVSLEMGYGTAEEGGSAAAGLAGFEGFNSIDNSLKDYFGYSHSMQVKEKSMYTNEQWRNMLIAELDLHHPLIYTGSSAQGGHGFVCDGYDEREYMHFNFGWSGQGDGYFPVDSISPGVGGVGGNVTYTFNLHNAALFGAVPVYELRVSDTSFSFASSGGSDSLILCLNPTTGSTWTVESSADWLTVETPGITSAGWVRLHAAAYDGSHERIATITFHQGDESAMVQVVQVNFPEDDFCPLKVIMEATRGDGWQGGAHLTLQSAGGYVFGTAALEHGSLDSVEIDVAPHDIYAVWHGGGGTDRFVNYRIVNQHGEVTVDVAQAYYDSGSHFIEWPCAHVGIGNIAEGVARPTVRPNPAIDRLFIDDLPADSRIELYDIAGQLLTTTGGPTLTVGSLPSGTYLLRIIAPTGVTTERIIKQ
jgi:hypothetical protein